MARKAQNQIAYVADEPIEEFDEETYFVDEVAVTDADSDTDSETKAEQFAGSRHGRLISTPGEDPVQF